MKLLACYTPSHVPLLKQHFMPSLELAGFGDPGHVSIDHRYPMYTPHDGATILLRELPQVGSGVFDEVGFHETCVRKLEFILSALTIEKEPFLFSDVDVRFYGPVVEDLLRELGQKDIVFQNDGPGGVCTGFFVVRPCVGMIRLFEHALEIMRKTSLLDQPAVQETMVTFYGRKPSASWGFLPDRYWTFGHNNKHWAPGMPVNPPTNLLVHHANWTKGIPNKLALLEAVIAQRLKSTGYLPVDWMERGNRRKEVAEHPRTRRTDNLPPRLPIAIPGNYKYAGVGRDEMGGVMRDPRGSVEFVDQPAKENAFTGYPVLTEEDVTAQRFRHDTFAPPAGQNMLRTEVALQAPRGHAGARVLPYSEVTRMLDEQRAALTRRNPHNPMPLALVLQFWKGDKRRALDLARLLADIEPRRRDDVAFVFARQSNCPMDAEIHEAQLYVGMKFPRFDLETEVDETKHYPGICFDPWASAATQLSDGYYGGRLPYSSAFFFEADGCPLSATWIDELKKAHAETLLLGKRVTGPLMRYGGVDELHEVGGHINGTLVMHLSCWADHPCLHRCPPGAPWDVFHGLVLRSEAGPSQAIANLHGMQGMTENQFVIAGKEAVFVTSIKDGTPQHWARRMLVRP